MHWDRQIDNWSTTKVTSHFPMYSPPTESRNENNPTCDHDGHVPFSSNWHTGKADDRTDEQTTGQTNRRQDRHTDRTDEQTTAGLLLTRRRHDCYWRADDNFLLTSRRREFSDDTIVTDENIISRRLSLLDVRVSSVRHSVGYCNKHGSTSFLFFVVVFRSSCYDFWITQSPKIARASSFSLTASLFLRQLIIPELKWEDKTSPKGAFAESQLTQSPHANLS